MAHTSQVLIQAAVFLDAHGTVDEALRRISPLPSELGLEVDDNTPLRPHPDDAVAGIRCKHGTAIYWYRRTIKELFDAFLPRPDLLSSTLEDALNLHESDGLKPIQVSELSLDETAADGVVLAGHTFVGFIESRLAELNVQQAPDLSETRETDEDSSTESYPVVFEYDLGEDEPASIDEAGISDGRDDVGLEVDSGSDDHFAEEQLQVDEDTMRWARESRHRDELDQLRQRRDDYVVWNIEGPSEDRAPHAPHGYHVWRDPESTGAFTVPGGVEHGLVLPPRPDALASAMGRASTARMPAARQSAFTWIKQRMRPRPDALASAMGRPSAFNKIKLRVLARLGRPRLSATVEVGGEENAHVGDDEAFNAFPKILAPDRVEPGGTFDLVIGLATAPVEGVEGTRVTTAVPIGTKEIDFEVHVTADRFKSEQGWSQPLKVKLNDFDSSGVRFRLTAPTLVESDRGTILALILVHFTRGGLDCGTAWRRLVVVPKDYEEPAHAGAPAFWVTDQPAPPMLNSPGPQFPKPDLTVRIESVDGDPASGKFAVTFVTPHAVALPSTAVPLNIGRDAPSFAKALISEMDKAEGGPLLVVRAPGFAKTIGATLPSEFWSVIDSVAVEIARKAELAGKKQEDGAPQPMTLLLMSAEGSVPWELAWMPKPLNPLLHNYLGVQVSIGRWNLGESGPPAPPKHTVGISRIAAISAYYTKESRLNQLQGAIDETKDMETNWAAVPINASPQAMADLLAGTYKVDGVPIEFQVLHFACHGQVSPTDPARNAVLLNDGQALNALDFRGARIGQISSPLLFLNACQVASGSVLLLGEQVGFAGSSTYAGFTAFVGPLWSVNDVKARGISHEFYDRAFKGESVGEILRSIRSRFDPLSPTGPTATPLAYVLYGNPGLTLTRIQ